MIVLLKCTAGSNRACREKFESETITCLSLIVEYRLPRAPRGRSWKCGALFFTTMRLARPKCVVPARGSEYPVCVVHRPTLKPRDLTQREEEFQASDGATEVESCFDQSGNLKNRSDQSINRYVMKPRSWKKLREIVWRHPPMRSLLRMMLSSRLRCSSFPSLVSPCHV